MSRIANRLQQLKTAGRKALVPYLVAGDPSPVVTLAALHALVAAGADILELGVPFSDPMAEGPVIQRGHERALQHRVRLRDVLTLVSQFRERDAETPVVLMGYANPIEAMGYAEFAAQAAAAGVDGILTVDMPPEEGSDLDADLRAVGIDTIYLIAPTTTADRLPGICQRASGYLYYVSLKGVTGAAHLDTQAVAERLAAIRAETDKPVCVGFGIKDAASARAIGALADGVVVGSALVERLGALSPDADAGTVEATVQAFLSPLRQALDAA